jgi:hypothetical protein
MGKNKSASGLTNFVQYDNQGNIFFVSGSNTLMSISSSGAITTTGVISGSNALSSSFAVSSSFALTGTTAATASSVANLNQNVVVTGSLTTTGQIVAQTLNVQQVTSSIVFSSGSNIFGNTLTNTQQLTGSVSVTGSLSVVTTGTELRVTGSGVSIGNTLTDSHTISGSLTINPNGLFISSSGNVGIGTTNPQASLHVSGAISEAPSANGVLMGIQSNYAVIHLNGTSGTGALIDFSTSGSDYKGRIEYDNSTNYMRFGTDGAERMRITSTGNVGIGTSTPLNTLTLAGNSGYLTFLNTAADGQLNTVIGRIASQVRTYGTNISTNSFASIEFATDPSGFWYQGNIRFLTNGSDGTGGNPTERMRITSGGNLLFTNGVSTGVTDTKFLMISQGTTSSTYAIVAKQSNNSTNLFALRDDGLFQTGLAANSPYNASISGRSAVIDSSGTLGYTSSTRESKTNIEILNDISWIYNLNPVSFNYRKKDDELKYTDEFYEDKWYGLIADEVESINQDLVFYNVKEDGTRTLAGVEYNKLISALVKAIQELKAEFDEYKATHP